MTNVTVIENRSETTVVETETFVEVIAATLGTVELVAAGPAGPTGPQGATGPQGPAGPGGTPGGAAGDLLVKASSADYDATWKSLQQISTEGTYIGGKAVILSSMNDQDVLSYDAANNAWKNAPAASLVDGGNF